MSASNHKRSQVNASEFRFNNLNISDFFDSMGKYFWLLLDFLECHVASLGDWGSIFVLGFLIFMGNYTLNRLLLEFGEIYFHPRN